MDYHDVQQLLRYLNAFIQDPTEDRLRDYVQFLGAIFCVKHWHQTCSENQCIFQTVGSYRAYRSTCGLYFSNVNNTMAEDVLKAIELVSKLQYLLRSTI